MEKLSASSASKHLRCHASADLESAIPGFVRPVSDPTANNAANRGTAMHDVFAQLMHLPASDVENFSAALNYVAQVRRLRRFKTAIEVGVTADWLDSAPGTTADLVLYTQDELHVLDLKTGKIPVSPVENDQLMYYAVTYGHLAPKATGATLHIVQPWAGVMDGWFADAARLQQFMTDMRAAEAAIHGGSTSFHPGDHCTFCVANPRSRAAKGKPSCPVLMDMYYPNTVDEAAILEED